MRCSCKAALFQCILLARHLIHRSRGPPSPPRRRLTFWCLLYSWGFFEFIRRAEVVTPYDVLVLNSAINFNLSIKPTVMSIRSHLGIIPIHHSLRCPVQHRKHICPHISHRYAVFVKTLPDVLNVVAFKTQKPFLNSLRRIA